MRECVSACICPPCCAAHLCVCVSWCLVFVTQTTAKKDIFFSKNTSGLDTTRKTACALTCSHAHTLADPRHTLSQASSLVSLGLSDQICFATTSLSLSLSLSLTHTHTHTYIFPPPPPTPPPLPSLTASSKLLSLIYRTLHNLFLTVLPLYTHLSSASSQLFCSHVALEAKLSAGIKSKGCLLRKVKGEHISKRRHREHISKRSLGEQVVYYET